MAFKRNAREDKLDGMASLPQTRRFTLHLRTGFCLAATVVAIHTCIQIEYWNYRAGGFLPRDIPSQGNQKWRVAADRSIRIHFQNRINMKDFERILAERGKVTAEESAAIETNPRPLTSAEQDELERELNESHTKSILNEWVSGWGVVQYVVAPLAFVSSLILLIGATSRSTRTGFAAMTALSGVTICFMLYRGYFTSLGW